MKLDWIYGRQKRKERKRDEMDRSNMNAAKAVGTGFEEGARRRLTGQSMHVLHNGGETKDPKETSIEDMV